MDEQSKSILGSLRESTFKCRVIFLHLLRKGTNYFIDTKISNDFCLQMEYRGCD